MVDLQGERNNFGSNQKSELSLDGRKHKKNKKKEKDFYQVSGCPSVILMKVEIADIGNQERSFVIGGFATSKWRNNVEEEQRANESKVQFHVNDGGKSINSRGGKQKNPQTRMTANFGSPSRNLTPNQTSK